MNDFDDVLDRPAQIESIPQRRAGLADLQHRRHELVQPIHLIEDDVEEAPVLAVELPRVTDELD